MEVIDKIRFMRELNQWSQEEMAEKMNMSVSGYAKIERGETNLSVHKLKQIAMIFDVDVFELVNNKEKGNIYINGENSEYKNFNNTNYCNDQELNSEIEKLNLIISHKNELLAQKEAELNQLKEIISLLKQQLQK
ncbi:transcriptional regulator [Pasteurellaceae bacterium RH1A]|nr:transcriptional regulator [Pasteurellaceae bacterium RH1A]